MNLSQSDEQIFKMAGLENNSVLGRWDFFLGAALGLTSPPPKAAMSSEEELRMRMIDEIDLDELSLEPISPPTVSSTADETLAAGSETKTKKKKSKKKKSASKSNDRTLKWGNVEQICFTRSIGYDRIPNRGAYPIGLGHEVERIKSTVDELYAAQQMYLMQRAIAKGVDLATLTKAAHTAPPPPSQSPSGPNSDLESPKVGTLKNGKKMSHRKRSNSVSSVDSLPPAGTTSAAKSLGASQAVVSAANSVPAGAMMPSLETRQYDYKSATNPLFSALGESERIAMLTSSTADILHDPKSHANPLTEVNNEIKVLKSTRDSSGCACKHTKIDKLSIAKLRAELVMNGHLICYEGSPEEIEKLSKPDLTKIVKDVLKVCLLCVANDCSCVEAGIPCSAQLCGCLRNGYHPGQAQTCANPNGRDLYDPERVKEYRRDVLRSVSVDLTPVSIKH